MRNACKGYKVYKCFYDPIEAGVYTIDVLWSGNHVTGSPYVVVLASASQGNWEPNDKGTVTHQRTLPPTDATAHASRSNYLTATSASSSCSEQESHILY